MTNIPHLLLAAGDSRRMGRPKQLLPWGEITLIENQIQVLLQTGQVVTVVIGAHAERILPVLEKLPVAIFINKEWANGMGNSLAFGVKMLNKKITTADGILISLLDQPLISLDHFKEMTKLFQPHKKQIIISQSSSGWKGVPVLFDKVYFEELQKLNADEGAKKIIQKHKRFVKTIECGNMLEDMDTPEEYEQLLKKL